MPTRCRRPAAFPKVSLVPPALLLALSSGCRDGASGGSLVAQAAALEASFPGRSATVLHAGTGFTPTAAGFVAAGVDEGPGSRARAARGRQLRIELPGDASEAIVFRAGTPGAPISVREIDARGEVHAVEQAVAYARSGGVSFWTALACHA